MWSAFNSFVVLLPMEKRWRTVHRKGRASRGSRGGRGGEKADGNRNGEERVRGKSVGILSASLGQGTRNGIVGGPKAFALRACTACDRGRKWGTVS